MEKKLGQEDIDALFAVANASAGETQQDAAISPEPYIFSRAGKISTDQMRAITTVNDLFARNLTHAMSGALRSEFKVKLVAGEQLPFSEFLERLSSLTYLCSVRLEPIGAVGLLQMDLSLAVPIVDILLGGGGEAAEPRELTDIEETIMASVLEKIVQELTLAWQPVGQQFAIEKRETEAQASRVMTMAEKTLCVSFELQMGAVQGALNLCLPAVVLNAILRRLISEGDRPRRRSEESASRIRSLIAASQTRLSLQLPSMRLCAAAIATLEPGSILRLPVARHQEMQLCIGDTVLASARAVRSREHRGAQLMPLDVITAVNEMPPPVSQSEA